MSLSQGTAEYLGDVEPAASPRCSSLGHACSHTCVCAVHRANRSALKLDRPCSTLHSQVAQASYALPPTHLSIASQGAGDF